MDKEALDALLLETRRRQRRKTDLSELDAQLKEIMDLNVSLPVMLTWIEKQGKTTTLPTLRRYVRRVFGRDYYDAFLLRNGWHRTKRIEVEASINQIARPERNERKAEITIPTADEELAGQAIASNPALTTLKLNPDLSLSDDTYAAFKKRN